MINRHPWRIKTASFILLILLVLGALATVEKNIFAGRYSPVWTGEFYYIPPKNKPNPTVQNTQYALKALHSVFAADENKFPGLKEFLDDKNNIPFKKAFEDMKTLRASNDKANATDLEAYIRSNKNSYLQEGGIQAWMNSFNPPAITSFSPKEGVGGDIINIFGTNLKNTSIVTFNGAKAAFQVISDTEVRAVIPKYMWGNEFTVVISNPFGKSVLPTKIAHYNGNCTDENITKALWELLERKPRGTAKSGECDPQPYGKYNSYNELVKKVQQRFGFVKRQPPKVHTAFPNAGLPGTKITIYGANLYQIQTVTIGNQAVDYEKVSDEHLQLIAPTSGGGEITVSTLSGVMRSKETYKVVGIPQITGFTPEETIVGDTLRIKGSNLGTDPQVFLNNSQIYNPALVSENEIHLKLNQALKKAPIMVRTYGGEAKAAGTVTVWTGQCRDTWIVKAFEELFERKPYGEGDEGQCTPANYRNGQWKSYEDLKFGIRQRYGYKQKPAPTISKITPSTGIAGQWVTIYGSGFDELQSVIFGSNVSMKTERRSSKELRAEIPFGAGSGDVVVSTLYGVGRFAGFGIEYPPSISNVNPTTSLPGVEVIMRGVSLGDVNKVYFGGTETQFKINSNNEISVTVPKGLSGFVEIKVVSPKGSSVWSPYGIVTAKFRAPEGSKSLRDLRLEIFNPDGSLAGSIPLIGNAGAGLTDQQIMGLLGNTGAALIGNAGAGLIGNAGAGLIGNAGAGLSIGDLSGLIGNAGAGLAGNSGGALIGNAGAGLIGNAGAGLIGNAGAGLIGNAGAGLIGNAGAGLVGGGGASLVNNSGGALIGNAGASLIGNAGAGLAGNSGGAFSVRGIQSLEMTGPSAKDPSSSEIKPVSDGPADAGITGVKDLIENIPTPESTPTTTPKPTIKPTSTPKVIVPTSQPTSTPIPTLIPTPVATVKPTATPTSTPKPTPAVTPTPTPVPTPTTTPTPSPTSSTEGQPCNPSIPKYQQPGCIETQEEQKRSPYDGLPCPGDSVPNYAKIGCIPQ